MNTELATGGGHAPPAEIAAGIARAIDELRAIRTFISQEFRDGTDFGTIPGCGDKRTLLLPGAQKASMYFNCYPTYKVKEIGLGGGHVEYRVRCLLVSRGSGMQAGEGLGSASTKEKKFRRGSAKECPSCGKPAIKRSKQEYGGGWYCNAKDGGCGAKFAASHKGLSEAKEVESEESTYEMHNTVLKMAKKRAHVDAAMTLGCLSELFTQDIEDAYDVAEVREAARPAPRAEGGESIVDGEVVPPAPKPSRANRHPNGGDAPDGRYCTREQADDYLRRLREKVDAVNLQWADYWSDGGRHEIPAAVKDKVMSDYQADGHLLKWAVENQMIGADALEKNGQPRLLGRYVGILFSSRPRSEAVAAKRELMNYFARCFEDAKQAAFRKHPELAPEGWAEEQAEAEGRDEAGPVEVVAARGDAYEGE